MREKRSRKSEQEEPIFDFCLSSLDFDEKLEVDFDGVDQSLLDEACKQARERRQLREQTFELLRKARTGADEAPTAPETAPSAEKTVQYDPSDPLAPEGFAGHHRRMERQERHMQALEKQQFIVTVGRVKVQRALLLKDEWKDSIQGVVKIDDMSDAEELDKKRGLALDEINKFLAKYAESRARAPSAESTVHKKKKKHKPKPAAKLAKPETVEEEEVILSFRPCAFGHMLPPKSFPPKEFALPALLVSEVEAYDLVDEVKEKNG